MLGENGAGWAILEVALMLDLCEDIVGGDAVEIFAVNEVDDCGGCEPAHTPADIDENTFYAVYAHQKAGGVMWLEDYQERAEAETAGLELALLLGWPCYNYIPGEQ